MDAARAIRPAEKERDAFHSKAAFLRHVASRSQILPKDDFIVQLCRDKRVLDIGCIDHSSDTALSLGDNWLHHRISRVARSTVGLDLLEKDAQVLNARGYDIRHGNAERFDLGERFDVVVAGDLIEHLSDIGSFLNSVKRHMRPDSLFVVTTPNPFNLEQAVRVGAVNRVAVNDQHTTWLDPTVAWELITRHSLEIVDFRWVLTRFVMGHQRPKLVEKMFTVPLDLMMWLRPLWRRDFALVMRLAT
jgi:2-polyprenyl-3-methyl-5-hydroxy-6-metoxy-1,4-benzoquinol methylase